MESNQALYNTDAVLSWYKKQQGLMLAEARVFEELKDRLPGFSLLDIGIGTGRTTAMLAGLCNTYVGIDYSARLMEEAKKQYPGANLRLMDARNLSAFNNGMFDMVNFSFNGIDYVTLTDRLQIMSEIRRVLKPGGIFFFSTHNKAHASFNTRPWLNRSASALINLKTFIRLLPFWPRHLAKKKLQRFNDDYALLNDSAHYYGLLTFYTTPLFLKEQLCQAGFTGIGLRTHSGEKTEDHLLDSWIFVTCTRSAL